MNRDSHPLSLMSIRSLSSCLSIRCVQLLVLGNYNAKLGFLRARCLRTILLATRRDT
jgi:hypothetical protein